jgi:hypothetical protein
MTVFQVGLVDVGLSPDTSERAETILDYVDSLVAVGRNYRWKGTSAGTENVEREVVRRSQMFDYDLIVGIVGLAKSRSEMRYNLTKLVLSIQGT